MPQVICTLENASDEINGIKFAPREDGSVMAEDVSDAAAEYFAGIPGYEIVTPAKTLTKAQQKAAEKAAAEAAKQAEEEAAAALAAKAAAEAAASTPVIDTAVEPQTAPSLSGEPPSAESVF